MLIIVTDKLITEVSQLLGLVAIITGRIAENAVEQAQASHK